jgi:hypothetical protein
MTNAHKNATDTFDNTTRSSNNITIVNMAQNKNDTYDEHNPPMVVATTLASEEAPPSTSPQPDVVLHSAPPSQPSAPNTNEEQTDPVTNKMVASGTAGAVLGFLFGGPLVAALLGFGAAYATKKDGAAGDAARALGDMAVSVKEKAIEVDQKHHVVDRSQRAAGEAWDSAKEYDQHHNVLEKTKDAVVAGWKSFTNFVRERRLLQRGVDGVGRGIEFVSEKVSGESLPAAGENETKSTL